jgi:hypothetical protein
VEKENVPNKFPFPPPYANEAPRPTPSYIANQTTPLPMERPVTNPSYTAFPHCHNYNSNDDFQFNFETFGNHPQQLQHHQEEVNPIADLSQVEQPEFAKQQEFSQQQLKFTQQPPEFPRDKEMAYSV